MESDSQGQKNVPVVDDEWVWRGKRKRRVYAVVRVDRDFLKVGAPGDGPSDGLDGVTVTQVLPTAEEAKAEVRRLNALGAEGRHVPHEHAYFWMATRYFPDGRADGNDPDSSDETPLR